MPISFDKLRRLFAKPSRSAVDISAAYAEADAIEREARAALAAAAPKREDVALDDATRAKARQAVEDAERQLADVAQWRGKLDASRAEAAAAEHERARREAYERASAIVGKPGAHGEAYDRAAEAFAGALQAMVEASGAAAEVNAALPAGAVPLVDPLLAYSRIAGKPRQVISEREVEIWCFAGTWRPLADDSRVVEGSRGRGYVPPGSGTVAGKIDVERRMFLRREVLPATLDEWRPSPIEATIPGWYEAPMRSPLARSAAEIIALLDYGRASRAGQQTEPKRKPEVELVPVSADGEVLGAVA